ncbi:MAG: aconitase family protein, partial [Stenotrophomonas sp.]
AMDMEQRMTLCNMSIEAGARAGMVAPDQVTFDWVANTPRGPKGADFDKAVAYWSSLNSDEGARFDVEVQIDASDIRPTLTWGTHPGTAIAVDAPIPAANDAAAQKGLDYMKFEAGHSLIGTPVDVVFVGSCTNGRLSDMREVAQVLRGRHVADGVRMLVVPGSEIVKRDAEAEGIHEVVRAAGAEWREPGCSMCIAMNGDLVAPGQLAVSTSNRNFEGRQGPGSRTLLASPMSAAWAAVNGRVADTRDLFAKEVA